MACVCFVVCDDVVDDDDYSNSTFNDLNQTHSTVCGSMHWLLLYVFWIWNIIKAELTHFICTVRLWPFTFLILSLSMCVCVSSYCFFPSFFSHSVTVLFFHSFYSHYNHFCSELFGVFFFSSFDICYNNTNQLVFRTHTLTLCVIRNVWSTKRVKTKAIVHMGKQREWQKFI